MSEFEQLPEAESEQDHEGPFAECEEESVRSGKRFFNFHVLLDNLVHLDERVAVNDLRFDLYGLFDRLCSE